MINISYNYDFGKNLILYKKKCDISIITKLCYGNIIVNYFHVQFYFGKDEYESTLWLMNYLKDDSEFYFYANLCKADYTLYLISGIVMDVNISNSYFNINNYCKIKSTYFELYRNFNHKNCYITDKNNTLMNNANGFTIENSDRIYEIMKSIGYEVNNSIIYDPLLPFYNKQEVNYEIFTSKQPKYKISDCNIKEILVKEISSKILIAIISITIIIVIVIIRIIHNRNKIKYESIELSYDRNIPQFI